MRGWIYVATAGGFEVPVQVRNIAFILPPDSRRGGVTLAFGHERLETTHGVVDILDMIAEAQVMPEVRVHGVTAAVTPQQPVPPYVGDDTIAVGAVPAPAPQTAVAAAMQKADTVKRAYKRRKP